MKTYITNKEIIKAFKAAGLKPRLKVGDWLNIARPDGMHCEFYPNDASHYAFTATYTLNNQEQTFDFFMPDDLDRFVNVVCKILEHNPKRKAA